MANNLVKSLVSTSFEGVVSENGKSYDDTFLSYFNMLGIPSDVQNNLDNTTYRKDFGGAFYVEFEVASLPPSNAALFEVSNQAADTRATIVIRTDGRVQLFVEVADATQANINAGSINVGSMNKLVIILGENNYASVLNGTTLGTDTSGSLPANVDTFAYKERVGGVTPLTVDLPILRYYGSEKDTAWAETITG